MTTPSEADLEFAIMLDQLGAAAIAGRDYEMGGYLWDAADWHAEPSEGTTTARIMLLCSAMAGEAARARAEQ